MKDEIIEELWQVKDQLARESEYDVRVLCQKLREQQASSHEQIIDRSTGPIGVSVQTKGTTLPGACARR